MVTSGLVDLVSGVVIAGGSLAAMAVVDPVLLAVTVVAHRLSTVVDADHIVVLEDGRAVASGTHDELVGTSMLYRDLAARRLLV